MPIALIEPDGDRAILNEGNGLITTTNPDREVGKAGKQLAYQVNIRKRQCTSRTPEP